MLPSAIGGACKTLRSMPSASGTNSWRPPPSAAPPKGGICRLTLTDLDRQVRDWFKARCEALGCTVTVDDMGVMFARRPGQRNDLPPIAMGSHLDTQPTGGKFDGVLGVLGALGGAAHDGAGRLRDLCAHRGDQLDQRGRLALRARDGGVRRICGRVHARLGLCAARIATARHSASALDGIGYRGADPCGKHPLSAFFELHIEQGPILEAEDKEIGIVTGVQGMRWYEVTVTGAVRAHRRDADAPAQERAAWRRAAWWSASTRSPSSTRRTRSARSG